MKKTVVILISAAGALLAATPLAAHDVKNMDHTHAFEQTGYGTYRQGHSVNNHLGDITVWSAKPHSGYQSGSTVKFARPEPITKAPTNPFQKTEKSKPYGKATKKNYGKTTKKNYGN